MFQSFLILFRQAGSNEKILLETFNAELEQVTPLGLRNFVTGLNREYSDVQIV